MHVFVNILKTIKMYTLNGGGGNSKTNLLIKPG